MPSDAVPAEEWPDSSDAQLIARVRTGDTAAYGGLFRRHRSAAVGFARRYANNASDAEDLAAEAFANVLSVLRSGSGPDVFFRAYLFATIVRLAGRLKASHLSQSLGRDVQEPLAAEDDPVLAAFESKAVSQAFKSLPERWQAVLWYTEIDRMKPSAIAPMLGLSANAVSALAVRAREGLRQAYLQQHISTVRDGSGCAGFIGMLGAYARGGLGVRARTKLEAHLAECSKCTAIYAQLLDIGSGMRTAAVALIAAAAAALATGLTTGGLNTGGGAVAAMQASGWFAALSSLIQGLGSWKRGIRTAVSVFLSAVAVVAAAHGAGATEIISTLASILPHVQSSAVPVSPSPAETPPAMGTKTSDPTSAPSGEGTRPDWKRESVYGAPVENRHEPAPGSTPRGGAGPDQAASFGAETDGTVPSGAVANGTTGPLRGSTRSGRQETEASPGTGDEDADRPGAGKGEANTQRSAKQESSAPGSAKERADNPGEPANQKAAKEEASKPGEPAKPRGGKEGTSTPREPSNPKAGKEGSGKPGVQVKANVAKGCTATVSLACRSS
ncbi:sigma-70 family RNA polymerase sigma factor [Arthrobacter sp. M4]|uniref:sigma-70 family RNA polymerase sigma factor n=1 Tax=Arthrobacter sp. M4 TaxID=218160 RepID=UPI001CDC4721|nr:sigma-70 family RNA polymerase sigma factor [Arthrobacter sp. M4]MCA4132980.1 sigma-70 family RNA polymerase sigma factor [Arthrobacter sp. M4]